MEPGRAIDQRGAVADATVEDVAAAGAVCADEVHVVARNLDALRVVGEAKADERALDVREVEDVLVLDDLHERAVGLSLAPPQDLDVERLDEPFVDRHPGLSPQPGSSSLGGIAGSPCRSSTSAR